MQAPKENQPPDIAVQQFLQRLVQDAPAHSRFLNMLSLLEHMGSRKIMLSQMNRAMDEDVLKHLAEEARHAFFFKHQAERVAGKELNGYENENTTALAAARMYFGRLDAYTTQQVGKDAAYAWVTRLVELRACWLYRIYQEILEKARASLSLKSLLAEEDLHLEHITQLCAAQEDMLDQLCAYEAELFEKLWVAIEADARLSHPLADAAE
jgi:hypothetical protein